MLPKIKYSHRFGIKDTQEARNFFQFISRPSYLTMDLTPLYNETPAENWLQIISELAMDFQSSNCELEKCPETYEIQIVTERGICTTILGAYSNYSSPE